MTKSKQSYGNPVLRFLQAIQHGGRRIFQLAEGVADAAFGSQNNPFYYMGGLTFFFLIIVSISGVYVYAFYDANIAGAHASIERITHEQWYLGGVMRSVHRYASDAMVLTMILHMMRRFFSDRYNGARAFSWITGVPMLWFVMITGLLGYWLVWDKLAQFIVVRSFEWLDWLPIIAEPMARNFLTNDTLTDTLFRLVMVTHLGLPLFLLAAVLLHTNRLHKPKILPPMSLMVGATLSMVVLSLIKPALSQEPVDMSVAPGVVDMDWFYLAAYPLVVIWPPEMVWALIIGGSVILAALPWLPPRKRAPAAVVDLDSCSGCNLCVMDCPYEAIRLELRSDGHPRYRFEAVVEESKCVSCGICTGSCPLSAPFRPTEELKSAIEMPQAGIQDLRDKIQKGLQQLSGGKRIVVFGCDHGLDVIEMEHAGAVGVSMECIGMLPTSFIDYTLRQGADGVFITGCRMGDCYHRLGNQFELERLDGERKPKLSRSVERERVGFSMAAETDQKSLINELEMFSRNLPSVETAKNAPTKQEEGQES